MADEEKLLELVILTPARELVRTKARRVIAVTPQGRLAVYPEHAPMLTVLDPAPLEITSEHGHPLVLAVSGGFFDVRDDRIVILTSAAETASEIDARRAEEAKARAEGHLEREESRTNRMRAEAALKRAVARLSAIERSSAAALTSEGASK